MSNTDSKSAEGLQELPAGFVPGEHDVVIGKGKKFYFHTGNQWLRTLVSSMLEEYKQAQTKSDKSNIISDVVEYVRQHGRFVKRDLKSGKWVYAEPLLCREKCSQTFRDNLAETYRSSNVAKRNKRRAEQQEKKRMPDPKRMRVSGASAVVSVSGMGAMTPGMPFQPQQHQQLPQLQPTQQPQQLPQQQQQQQGQAPAPIPSNLFDLEMPLWSPKQNTVALLPNSLDFSALTRGSITGTAGGDNSLNLNMNLNNGNNLNASAPAPGAPAPAAPAMNNATPTFQLSGLSSMNLLQNLPDILNNLSQIAAGAAPAPAGTTSGTDGGSGETTAINPFEPTPLTNGLPPLTGTLDLSGATAAMPSLETGNIFEPRPIQEKRHSLAMVSDLDWLKVANVNVNVNGSSEGEQQAPDFNPKISAAFAA